LGEIALEQLAQAQVVVDDQNFGFGFVHDANPSRIEDFVPARLTNDYKPGRAATVGLQRLSRMQACRKSGGNRRQARRQS
ncbi:MAG: hypothetical protein NDI67_16090, partial [Sulfuritalea sp.]|nr:hypothetical protein [Sulfuritalea sp.]